MNRQRTLLSQSPPYRTELSMLEQQNAILKLKCKKAIQLQEKVEMVLRQNSQLLNQNQKMSRLLHQSKSQNESLRTKIQTLSVQKINFTSDYQIERKKLIVQLQRMNEELAQLQLKKNSQINELKNAFTMQLQTLKRQLQSNQASFQSEIRKYRDLLEKRELQLSDCVNKLKRLSTQSDYQILKLREQKEKLKIEISFLQNDRVKQLENLKTKLENNYFEQLEALKRAHLGALQEAQIQNSKLRQSLDSRGRYLEELNNKYNKQKLYLEDNINSLKRENEMLRNKIIQTQKIGQYENHTLKNRLSNLHDAELQNILNKHQSEVILLQNQINRLQDLTNSKNQEIQQFIKQKMTNRLIYDSEIGRVKEDYNLLFQKNKELQLKYAESTNQSVLRLNDRQKHIQYLEDLLKEQNSNAETQQTAFQKSIQVLKNDLNSERMIFRQKEQAQKEEVASLKHRIAQLELEAEKNSNDFKKQINSLKDQLSGTSSHLNNKAESLNSKNRVLQKQNETLKNNITLKEKEIKALTDRLKASSERQSRLEAQIDDLRNKIIKNQQKSNELVNDQKGRLESTYFLAIQSIKSDHEAALRLQHNRYKDLAEKLRKKESELQDLLRKYKKMIDQIQVLTDQQANKKDMTLKYPGATADLIATKNLFDIYLKTKVLDVCGDALKQMPKTT